MLLRKNIILFILLVPALAACCLPAAARAGSGIPAAAAPPAYLVDNGGYAVGRNGGLIGAHNLHTPYVPASIIKIATALEALDILGLSFRFETRFYRDSRENLYIKGFGDPFLISEEVALIVARLKGRGCTKINDIYLDDTAFALEEEADPAGWSENPYDARNSALAVNFNTVNIQKDKTGRIAAAEAQTPTLPIMAEMAAHVEPGIHRINITPGSTNGAEMISRYVGELFRAFQKQENIAGHGVIARRRIPENLSPFYIHHSEKTLGDIIGPLMHYSNNFIANQIFLTAGAVKFGYPATWEKGRQAMAGYLQQQIQIAPAEIQVFEGSGISRKNRVSPAAMMELLDTFKPFARLLPRKKEGLLKSGTLTGVYCYAGYFTDGERLDPFVLMLNQAKNNRNRLLQALEEIYHSY